MRARAIRFWRCAMSARPIGDIIPAILKRCNDFQLAHMAINLLDTDAEKKEFILSLRFPDGITTNEEIGLLLEVYGLQSS